MTALARFGRCFELLKWVPLHVSSSPNGCRACGHCGAVCFVSFVFPAITLYILHRAYIMLTSITLITVIHLNAPYCTHNTQHTETDQMFNTDAAILLTRRTCVCKSV